MRLFSVLEGWKVKTYSRLNTFSYYWFLNSLRVDIPGLPFSPSCYIFQSGIRHGEKSRKILQILQFKVRYVKYRIYRLDLACRLLADHQRLQGMAHHRIKCFLASLAIAIGGELGSLLQPGLGPLLLPADLCSLTTHFRLASTGSLTATNNGYSGQPWAGCSPWGILQSGCGPGCWVILTSLVSEGKGLREIVNRKGRFFTCDHSESQLNKGKNT